MWRPPDGASQSSERVKRAQGVNVRVVTNPQVVPTGLFIEALNEVIDTYEKRLAAVSPGHKNRVDATQNTGYQSQGMLYTAGPPGRHRLEPV